MDGTTGYKYVRATFSNALNSLSEADIEIRNVKTGQLYSVEKVALSTDGYTADITIAGDAAVSGTTFLQPATIYSCKIDADGAESTLEFQLPNIFADVMVVSADTEKNTIDVFGSVRKGGQQLARTTTFNVGDAYEDNLGELVGRTVTLGVDADNNVVSLRVNDGEVAFGYVKAKSGDGDNFFNSPKDYFETASGDKYYLSNSYTSASNWTIIIPADNDGNASYIDSNPIAKDETFEYAKMILNPNGTVSAAVVWTAFDDHIFATTTDGSVAKETKDNSKDFKGYTVIDGLTFEYVDPKTISEGDVIYYDSDDKLAFIYNNSVTGDLENVYEDKLDIDGTKYNFIVWYENAPHVLPGAKNAEYYDADNDTYEFVTEKWANTLDKTEPVTIFLDTKGDGVLVEGTVGETVTHSKEYIVTQSPKVYVSGLTTMIDMSVSDGTEVTLHIPLKDLTSIDGNKYGDSTLVNNSTAETAMTPAAGGNYVFAIKDGDGKKTGTNAAGKVVPNLVDGADPTIDAFHFQQGSLIDVIYNDDETKVTGLKLKNGQNDAATNAITMKVDDDVEFKAGLTSIKTNAGSLTLAGTTKVYVLTGTRLPDTEVENDSNPYTDTTQKYKEASDNKVKVYNYSDFDKNTQAGTYQLKLIITEKQTTVDQVEETTGSGATVGSLVRFAADKTAATAVIIDDRGFNNGMGIGDLAKLGTVDKAGDANGGQVFKKAETKTKVLGVATATEYQKTSDGTGEQLAEIKILTVDGSVTLDDIDAEIDTDLNAKNRIVLAELDATGKVTKLTEFAEATGAAAVDQVNFGVNVTPTASTDTIVATSTAGNYNVKTDTDCLVVKFNGSSFSESTIGDINRDADYVGVKFYTSQLNGSDVKAKVIVATKSITGAGYAQTATLTGGTRTATYGTALVADTATTIVDQYGENLANISFFLQGSAATTTSASFTANATQPGISVAADGHTLEVTTTAGLPVMAGGYKFDIYALAGGTAIAGETKVATVTVTVSPKTLAAADIVMTPTLTTARKLAAGNMFTITNAAATPGTFTATDLDSIVVSYCNNTAATAPAWVAIPNATTDTAESGTTTGLAWTFGTGSTTIDESVGTNVNGALKVTVTAKGNYTGTVTYTIAGTTGNGISTTTALVAD